MKARASLVPVLIVAFAAMCRAADDGKPLQVLLVAGGCCHDYATQTQLLKKGIEARVRSHVEVAYNPDTSTKATFPIYEKDDWDSGYDVVLHDECSAAVTDRVYVARILAAHRRGTPAVNIHCGLHSYRWGDFKQPVASGADNAGWYEMVGVQSTGHGPQFPITVAFTDRSHPITKPLADWTTIKEELYNTIQVFPTATVLAQGTQEVPPPTPKGGQPADPAAKPVATTVPVAWTNDYGPKHTRIFSTSLGHNNETVGDDRYLDLVTRGLLWASGRLGADGEIAAGLSIPAGEKAATPSAP